MNLTEEEKIANRNKRFGAQRQPKVNSAMLQKSMQSSTSPPPPLPPSQQQQQQHQVAVAAVSEVQDPGAVAEEAPESAAPASLGQPREPLEQELEEGEEPTVE